jgi:hypothetical protein
MPAITYISNTSTITGISASAHGLIAGDYCTIQDSESIPGTDGTYQVYPPITANSFFISASSNTAGASELGYVRRLKFVDFIDGFASGSTGDGRTYATRRNDLTSFSATELLGDDYIRICQSPTQSLCSVSASWINGQQYVLIENSNNIIVKIDDCDAGWVSGSTNMTVAHSLSLTSRKLSSALLTITAAAAFTTGKMAVKTLSTGINLSGYNAISFWHYTPSATYFTSSITLCSDNSGSTPVHTFVYTPILTYGTWIPVTLQCTESVTMSATPIKSVAINALSDPGTAIIYWQNIIACNYTQSQTQISNSLHHNTLIGKNDGEWYSVGGIDISSGGTLSCSLSSFGAEVIASNMPYTGSTESVPLYTLTPIRSFANQLGSSTGHQLLNRGGVSVRYPIIYSGGWRKDDMISQVNCDTYFNGWSQATNLFLNNNNYIQFNNIGVNKYRSLAAVSSGQRTGVIINNCKFISNFYALNLNNQTTTVIDNAKMLYNRFGITGVVGNFKWSNSTIKGCYTSVISSLSGPANFNNCLFLNNQQFIFTSDIVYGVDYVFKNCTVITPDISEQFSKWFGQISMINCTTNLFDEVDLVPYSRAKLIQINHNGSVNNNYIRLDGGKATSQNVITHTGTNYCPKIDINLDHIYKDYPLIMPIGEILVQGASKQVTASVWIQHNSGSVVSKLVQPDYAVSGSLTNSSGSWNQVSVMFQPTKTEVLPLEVWAYDKNSATDVCLYVADVTIQEN